MSEALAAFGLNLPQVSNVLCFSLCSVGDLFLNCLTPNTAILSGFYLIEGVHIPGPTPQACKFGGEYVSALFELSPKNIS